MTQQTKKSGQSSGTSKATKKSGVERVKEKIREMMKQAEEFELRKPELEKEAADKISYAKSRLMQMEPFFAMLLFKMPAEPCYQIPTMATDGTHLLYNPVFVAEHLLRKDVVFVLLHEIEHIFFKHHLRGPIKGADAKKIMEAYDKQMKAGGKDIFIEEHLKDIQHWLKEWNFATDYVINYSIKKDVKLKCSDKLEKIGILYDEKFKDHTAEMVYNKIKTEREDEECQKCNGAGCSECSSGNEHGDGDLGIGGVLPAGFGEFDEKEIAQAAKDLESEVRAAALSARKAGKLPAGIEKMIEDLYSTSTPWQDVFRTIFTQISKQDYTFRFPNKRYSMHQAEYGVIMPSLTGEEYTDAWFIMDTSGSVGEQEKSILVSELKHILEDYPIRLHVIYCDTEAYIDNIETLTREDIQNGKLRLDVKGGGGTNMKPAFDHINSKLGEIDPEVVICMTDMFLWSWDLGQEPEYSVFWARLPNHDSNAKPPWGVCIDIVLDQEKY